MDYYEQHFKYIPSCTHTCMCMKFKNFEYLNPILMMKIFTKLDLNLCMEEFLIIQNNLCDKFITLIAKTQIYMWIDGKRILSIHFLWELIIQLQVEIVIPEQYILKPNVLKIQEQLFYTQLKFPVFENMQ